MEIAGRAMELATRAVNSNGVINVVLVGVFGLLSVRSLDQQRQIERLETEKDRLFKSNKAIKKTLWDWKQQLYAEASESTFPTLSTLKSIYNDAPATQSTADAGKADGKSAPSKILI